MAKINIGKDFSTVPAGRYYADGDHSGQKFREEYLLRAVRECLKTGEKLTIMLDNVDTYGSSFLEESFGGMVREGYVDKDKFIDILDIRYEDSDYEFYRDRILEYIREAEIESK